MTTRTRLILVAALLAAVQVHARSYLLVGSGSKLPAKIEAAVAAAGGTVTRLLPQVRVAVLDSGVASTHLDIAPNLNTALCTSFVPGEPYNYTGTGFNHGTHTAGTIAAAANGVGTVGVAPKAELVAVKVLSADSGSGS